MARAGRDINLHLATKCIFWGFRVDRGQQALFALVDAFAKAVLTCVPEPPPDARPQATARARERYDRLIKAAGQAMSGDARTAMEDLVSHGTK
jgi:hypothetical protein